jgi:hypothetical protein
VSGQVFGLAGGGGGVVVVDLEVDVEGCSAPLVVLLDRTAEIATPINAMTTTAPAMRPMRCPRPRPASQP